MKVWAHRGASAYAPQNTLEAFRLAAEMHADGVELDVHLSKDGEVIVCHDETIATTSNGVGLIIDMTLEELKQYDFGCKFAGGGFEGKGVRVPTLREVYELLAPTGLMVNVELKTNVYEYPGIEQKCLDLAREFGMEDRIVYSSFHFDSLRRVLALDPTARTALLYEGSGFDALKLAKNEGAWALHPKYRCVYEYDVRAYAEAGVVVNPWTVDDPAEMKKQMDMGINALITDNPDLAIQVREGKL